MDPWISASLRHMCWDCCWQLWALPCCQWLWLGLAWWMAKRPTGPDEDQMQLSGGGARTAAPLKWIKNLCFHLVRVIMTTYSCTNTFIQLHSSEKLLCLWLCRCFSLLVIFNQFIEVKDFKFTHTVCLLCFKRVATAPQRDNSWTGPS